MVYCENDSAAGVRLGIFKWVRAGWQDINMVRSFHIYRGMNRFAKGMQKILNTPQLADTSALRTEFKRIRQLPHEDLKAATREYLARLRERYRKHEKLTDKETAALFEDDRYLNQLTRKEMESILIIEYLKDAAGKNGNS